MNFENGIKVYDNAIRTNPVFWNMAINCTDASDGQLVNFGPKERKGLRKVDEQIQELIEKGVIKHVKDDLYRVSPYIIGKGNWEDICSLRERYQKL